MEYHELETKIDKEVGPNPSKEQLVNVVERPFMSQAPTKGRTSKDLLQLEGSGVSLALGAKWKSICKVKKERSISPSSLKTMPMQAVVAESNVLRRVQAFLPAFDEANRKLAEAIKEKGPEDFDIEVLRSHEANSYVEMDLALGVADLYSEDAVSAAENLAGGKVVNTASLRLESDSEDERASLRDESDSEDERCSPSRQSKNDADGIRIRMKRKPPPKIEPLS